MMDLDKDGRISLDDFTQFGVMSINTIKQKEFQHHELGQQLQAHCTLELWKAGCGSEANEDDFVAWLCRVLQENEQFRSFEEVPFASYATVKLVYEILQVR
jgi:hypothetical protein